MALKEALQHIFNNDYQGTEAFINEVIIPVFGNDIHRINLDYAQDDEYHEKAEKAGIQNLIHVAQISDERYNSNDISFFDVTLKDNVNVERARVNIQQLIRSIVARFSHILIVFHYEDVANRPWRFSYAYKQSTITSTTSAKRYTYVFGRDFRGRTAAERFEELKDSQHSDEDFEKAFSVQALSDEFFDHYRAYYAVFVEYITGEKYSDESKLTNIIRKLDWKTSDSSNQFETTFERDAKATRDYIKKMFGRIVFLYFLQRKGWLYDNDGRSDAQYMKHLFDNADALQTSFLDDVLEILFFYVLNTKPEDRISEARKVHKDVTILPGWDKIPFLNGGLFEQDDIDPKKCTFPAEYFREFFNFLNSYNFIIDENDQEDAEIGIDPEMLGRIFENLLEDNKDKGAFYTPKEIVDYMCRESIIAYLLNDVPEDTHNLIRNFVETLDASQLNAELKYSLRKKLQAVKICDPAIGSGAFPMGLVNLLSKLYVAMKSDTDTAKMKRHIMEQNIYGVDIEQGAVDIARLRFWLAMIVEEKEPIPLPNLHFKIMQGNSLLECYDGVDLSDLAKYIQQVDKRGQLLLDYTDNNDRIELNSLLKQYYGTSKHDVRDSIFKSIIDNVREQLKNKGVRFPESKDPSANMDFFLWHTWFSDVFDNGGFDIVIGNPPYIKEYTNRNAFDGFRETSSYYKGKMDLWYGFACHCIDLLKKGGVLSFIATNNWVKSSGASLLRKKIRNDARLSSMIDFGTYMIFGDSASIQTMIMFVIKDNSQSYFNTFFSQNLLSSSDIKDIEMLLNGKAESSSYTISKIERKDSDKIFSFGSHEVTSVCDKISLNATFLSDEHIAQGIIGAPDEAFILTDINKFTEEEKQYIKPYYTGLTQKYILTPTNKFVLYLSAQNFSELEFENSKNIKNHFEPYRDKLIESKIKFKTPKKPYYFLHRERKESFFKGGTPRLLTQGRTQEPIFVYTEGDCYPSRALFVIATESFDLKFLCGLLNSSLIKFWLKHKGKMQGACYQIDKGPILSIPIKVDSVLSNQIKELTDDILNGISKENEIDHIVYHLYDLTYDEVLIIDPETPITREEYEKYNF